MMPPTVAASNSWQQQQQQHTNLHQQQQQQPPLQQQQQQQQPMFPVSNYPTPAVPMAQQPSFDNHVNYGSVFGQPQPQQQQPMYTQPQQQQPLPPQQPQQQQQHDASWFFPQQQPATQQHEYFVDNTNNNVTMPVATTNGVGKSDGWGDWDWNDNTNEYQSQQQQYLQQPPQQQPTLQQQQQAPQQQPPPQQAPLQQQQQQVPLQQQQAPQQQPPQHQQPPQQQPMQQQQLPDSNDNLQQSNFNSTNIIEDSFSTSSNDNWHWNVSEEQPTLSANTTSHVLNNTGEHQMAAVPSTIETAEPTNENFNQIPLAPPADQQSPVASNAAVFVSQAKPVARPPRQYASLPAETPTPENALTPPQAFRNDNAPLEQQQQQLSLGEIAPPPAAVTAQPPPPTAAVPPPAMLPPPTAGATTGNPFKRAGVAQHHRATALMSTNANALPAPPSVFSAAPPPPADFANPADPENIEDLHENQEVVPMAATAAAQPTLPNADRNQYLQTSHLSENPDYESGYLEGDGVLPPPGLSRLVLGQPELASQRMVTGTEEPATALGAMPPTNLDIEERHADGEDTSMEHTMMMGPQPDRNRYMVPGESQAVNEQRVVTGVENIPLPVGGSGGLQPAQPVGNPEPQIISEQREIVLDGENLEDLEQQQQQQQQHTLSRNEPPLEGAVSASMTQTPVNVEIALGGEGHPHPPPPPHSAKSKDTLSLTNASTGNDESDPLLEEDFDEDDHRGHGRYGGKARGGSKYELAPPSERGKHEKLRKDKQRPADRSESAESEELEDDDYHLSMRERDRRRNYREGSVRSDREDRDYKDSRRQRRDKRDTGDKSMASSRDKYYYGGGGGSKSDRTRSQRYSSRYDNGAADSSKYETEESTRHESGRGAKEVSRRSGVVDDRRSDRSERDYDDYQRRYRGSKSERERRERYAGESGDHEQARRRDAGRHYRRGERDDYDTTERRRRSDKHRSGEASAAAASAREYEEYRKQSSRNARESDLEKEGGGGRGPRGVDPRYDPRMHASAGAAQMAMYGGYPGYAYDPTYAAYYYEQMARTNPQAYSEWYKKYYGHAAAASGASSTAPATASGQHHGPVDHLALARDDGRESVHSGRSSIAALHSDKDRSGNLSMRDPEPDPQRLTPCKFINEHTVVSISGGILVTVKPKYTPHGSISNVVKLQRISANDGMRHLYQTYPGPLVRGLTHKKTIIEFCEEQIRLGPMQTTIFAKQLLPSNVDKYKASYTLMWNLLILLLRQNGMVVGTDIAELLLKNQQQFPYALTAGNSSAGGSPQQAKSIAATSDGSEADYDKLSDEAVAQDEPQPKQEEDKDGIREDEAVEREEQQKSPEAVGSASSPVTKPLTDDEITEKFRNYLLYGNVNEALDWATDNNLWGHALFLASKVDRRSHANVMMKFANKLSLNDPLQTLYQLMSGRTPSSVTSVQDEKWGDWRPHLSMILSNTSQKPELDRKAITTLGDSLFNRGDLFAAHFCYLMAQVGFGRYQESATAETTLQQSLPKLVLLGSSHYKSLRDFATNESIMMTEIYEYACSLNDDKFSLVEFQPYKYMLASRMADYGFHLKSLMYMEQIALHIERDSTKYEPSFIQKIYDLADRLKYYDPVLEKTLDDQHHNLDGSGVGSPQNFEEQKWLQNLRNTVSHYKVDSAAYETESIQYQNQIDQQFDEINKQFNQLNMQYANDNVVDPNQLQQQTAPPQPQQLDVQPQFYNPEVMAATQPLIDPQQQSVEYQQQQQPLQQQPAAELNAEHVNYTQQKQQQQQYMQPDPQQQPQIPYYDPQQQQQQYNALDTSGVQQQQHQPPYDYWSPQQQQASPYGDENAAQRPTISLPKTKSYDSDEDNHKKQQQQKGAGGGDAKNTQQQQQRGKVDNKENKDKSSQQGNQNSGWFGGIWNKLSLKPKNQMILPDDKNPSIVWDPEKKRWVNTTDGDEAAEEAFKPPPKMSDIVTQAQQQQQQQYQQQPPPPQQQQPQYQQQQQYPPQAASPQLDPTPTYGQFPGAPMEMPPSGGYGAAPSPALASAAPASEQQQQPQMPGAAPAGQPKPPSLQSNMFKMQRNRTLKNSYVDVFNPSGAPMSSAADNVLAPALPPAAVPQGGFFIPGPAPAVPNDPQGGGYQQQPQQQDVPQFYNPNQYGNAAPSGPGGY